MVGRSDTGAVLGEGWSKQKLRFFAKAKVGFDRTEVFPLSTQVSWMAYVFATSLYRMGIVPVG